MSKLKYIDGNILEAEDMFDVIAHGCNCFCNFGAGLAKAIKHKYPEAYKADLATRKGDKKKLGSCSYHDYHGFTVVNAYTQYYYGGGKVNADYKAIRKCMKWIKNAYSGKRIGLPKIGAGLAKGDWKTIEKIIEEELKGEDVTIVNLKK
jgi:O-acetyl-ADP-ribose deacetylase (regulator of RNase III)